LYKKINEISLPCNAKNYIHEFVVIYMQLLLSSYLPYYVLYYLLVRH
jgi:hypothetical protein